MIVVHFPEPQGMLRGESAAAAVNSGQVTAITVDKDGDDNTELVPIHAQAGCTPTTRTGAPTLSTPPTLRSCGGCGATSPLRAYPNRD